MTASAEDEASIDVTDALASLDAIEDDTPAAHLAWLRVSVCEERLAAVFAPLSVEGELARTGAVFAAIAARDPVRAFALIERYRVDATTALRDQLSRLETDAGVIWSALRAVHAPSRFSFLVATETW